MERVQQQKAATQTAWTDAHQRLRVLVADDHAVVRASVAALLRGAEDGAAFDVVAEANDGHAAVAAFRQHRPDVALFDLRMPGLSGVDAARTLRADFPDARLIILTSFEGDEDIHNALSVGVAGYLLKDCEPADLIAALRTVAAGGKWVPERISHKLIERMASSPLSPRELDVLRLLAAGMSNAQVGAALFISEGTVKTHVNNILSKLGASDRTNAVVTGLKRGLITLGG